MDHTTTLLDKRPCPWGEGAYPAPFRGSGRLSA